MALSFKTVSSPSLKTTTALPAFLLGANSSLSLCGTVFLVHPNLLLALVVCF